MKERLIIVFVAVVIGLVATTVGYLLYQSFQNPAPTPTNEQPKSSAPQTNNPTPTPDKSFFITITEPKPEELTDKRTITVKGTTNPGNTVIISTNQDDVVAEPKEDGSFSTTVTINAGSNILVARAMNDKGETVEETRVITFVSEDF
jgi:cytoskeletal protein RodZ